MPIDGAWLLRITDDGVGFSDWPESGHDIGLVGMRERARALGGRLIVISAPGQGTTVEASVPMKTMGEEGATWRN